MRINLNINVRVRALRVAKGRVLPVLAAVAIGVLAGCAARLPEPGAADALRAAAQLSALDAAETTATLVGSSVQLSFVLPRQGVSLLVIR